MNRLQAIQHLRLGASLTKNYFGYEVVYGKRHSYKITVSKRHTVITCNVMREAYVTKTTFKDVLRFIKRNYKSDNAQSSS